MIYNFTNLNIEILHDLKQRKLSKNYYKKYNKLNPKIYNFLKIIKHLLNFFTNLPSIFIRIFKTSFAKNFIKKKKYKIIVFIDEKLVDQKSTFLFCKILKKQKKGYLIINKTINKKLLKKENYINYDNFISYNLIFKFTFRAIINFIQFKKFIKINNFSDLNKVYLFNIYFKYIFDSCIAEDIYKYFNPDYIYINQNSLNYQNIIETLKLYNNKIQIVGNCFNGVKLSNQILTIEYLWNAIDHLLCFGALDAGEFLKIKKKKFLKVPKKIYKIGSPRDYIFKSSKKKKINKTILFIKSNPNMQKNFDEKAMLFFLRAMNRFKFKNKIQVVIKDRAQINQQTSLNKLKNEYNGPIKIIKSEYELTEKLISNSDLIIGTYSTSFIYQSIFFRKPIIQIYGNKVYWCNLRKYGIKVCNKDEDLDKEIKNFYFNFNNFKSKKLKNIKKLRKKLFSNKNTESNLGNFIKKIII